MPGFRVEAGSGFISHKNPFFNIVHSLHNNQMQWLFLKPIFWRPSFFIGQRHRILDKINMKSRNSATDRQSVVGNAPASSAPIDRRRPAKRLTTVILVLFAGVWFGTFTAHAQDATWSSAPTSNNWNTAANWVPPAGPSVVPTGTASFGASTITSLAFLANASVGTLQFNAGAPAYSFNLTHSLSFTGAGIGNGVGGPTTFNVLGTLMQFSNVGSAGDAIIIVNGFGAGALAIVNFQNGSNAGSATITNSAFGETDFRDTSTAGNATITTNSGGRTQFFDSSTAGSAQIITNNGGIFDISNLVGGGFTVDSIAGGGTYFLRQLHPERRRHLATEHCRSRHRSI
jgi:hypothetical protein